VAQRSMRKDLPRRFYTTASIEADGGFHALLLDGKAAKTPGRNRLSMPDAALGEAMAAEWRAQADVIDPATMPLTRIANVALDRVSQTIDAVRADMAKYAGSDMLCYRADTPQRLVLRQEELWNPVLAWAASPVAQGGLNARFTTTTGLVHVAQPATNLDAVATRLALVHDAHCLTGLHMVTTLTGSVLLALALEAGAFDADAIWAAAHVDEDVQIEIWGDDDEALARRLLRRRDYDAAALVIRAQNTSAL
jgi:chaperone required for assembly of F1-ATPase